MPVSRGRPEDEELAEEVTEKPDGVETKATVWAAPRRQQAWRQSAGEQGSRDPWSTAGSRGHSPGASGLPNPAQQSIPGRPGLGSGG